MKTNNKRRLILIVFVSLLPAVLSAEADLYSFPEIDQIEPKKPEEKTRNAFTEALARKTGMAEKTLYEAAEKGLGRVELTRLVLIAKKSGKPLEDLIKDRESGIRLKKMAETAKLDNRKIRQEAEAMLDQIETEEKKIQAEIDASSGTAKTAAGTQVPKDKESKMPAGTQQ